MSFWLQSKVFCLLSSLRANLIFSCRRQRFYIMTVKIRRLVAKIALWLQSHAFSVCEHTNYQGFCQSGPRGAAAQTAFRSIGRREL